MRLQLIMIAGLLSTGKTSLAENLARQQSIPLFAPHDLRDVQLPEGLREAKPSSQDLNALIKALMERQLGLGVSVIVEGVFANHATRQEMSELAVKYNAEFCPIYMHCSDEGLWKQRLLSRMQSAHPDDTFTGWHEVQIMRRKYAPWSPDYTLYIDSAFPMEENMEAVIKYLKSGMHRPYVRTGEGEAGGGEDV